MELWLLQCMRDGELPGDRMVPDHPSSSSVQSEQQVLSNPDRPKWQWPRVKTLVYDQYRESCGSKTPLGNHLFWPKLALLVKISTHRPYSGKEPKIGWVTFPSLQECIRVFAMEVMHMPDASLLEEWLEVDSHNEAAEGGDDRNEQRAERGGDVAMHDA